MKLITSAVISTGGYSRAARQIVDRPVSLFENRCVVYHFVIGWRRGVGVNGNVPSNFFSVCAEKYSV